MTMPQPFSANLLSHNTYRLHAYADYIYTPASISEICKLLSQHPDLFILGNGSNVIFTQSHYKRLRFMLLKDNFCYSTVHGTRLTASAGASLRQISVLAKAHALSNLEVFYDIPASVGGALWMNAGAYGESIYDYVTEVTTISRHDGCVYTYSREQLHYGYRYSRFQDSGEVIVQGRFALEPAAPAAIQAKMDTIYGRRNRNLPKQDSAGSVFKRPDAPLSVGEMVEKLGLKGHRIGGAMISPRHGGIIINTGSATAADILALIELIQNRLKAAYGVSLSLEQIPV